MLSLLASASAKIVAPPIAALQDFGCDAENSSTLLRGRLTAPPCVQPFRMSSYVRMLISLLPVHGRNFVSLCQMFLYLYRCSMNHEEACYLPYSTTSASLPFTVTSGSSYRQCDKREATRALLPGGYCTFACWRYINSG